MRAAPAALPNLCPLLPPLPCLGNNTGVQLASSRGSPVRSLYARGKSLEMRTCSKLQTAPGHPMSRSEVCCCIACSETCSGLLLHGNGGTYPQTCPPMGAPFHPREATCTVGAVRLFTITKAELLVQWSFGGSQQSSRARLPRVRLWTGSGAASWRPPRSRGLSARPGLPSKPVPPCWRQTDPDSFSISGWDKKHPPHCSQPSSRSL